MLERIPVPYSQDAADRGLGAPPWEQRPKRLAHVTSSSFATLRAGQLSGFGSAPFSILLAFQPGER
jgi:hypothetical protein